METEKETNLIKIANELSDKLTKLNSDFKLKEIVIEYTSDYKNKNITVVL